MSELDRLGTKHKKLLADLEALKPQLHEAMRAERAAGATQNDIRDRAGYKTVQQVRVITGEAKARPHPSEEDAGAQGL